MAVKYLPETITKELLFEEAQRRFQSWAKMFGDPNVTAQHMYEDMSCSCYSGSPSDDFPEQVGPASVVIKYHYKNGMCYFMIDGIEVEVLDCRDMRKDPSINCERYSDVCILSVSYKDDSDCFIHHIIPNTWLYGSTSSEFNEGVEVHTEFIEAAREYIKQHNITPDMQEVPDD